MNIYRLVHRSLPLNLTLICKLPYCIQISYSPSPFMLPAQVVISVLYELITLRVFGE